ncbi:MAG: hypothetical protein AAF393_08375 [Pseudomonadota bacterium]
MANVIDNPAPLFTGSDGNYRFARWNKPLAPVIFGVDDDTLTALKAAITQTVAITGASLGELDPDLGANFMWFFCREWDELKSIPNLDRLLPDFDNLLGALKASGTARYRTFGFDADGAIQLCVVLIRVDGATADQPIQTLATAETLQSLLLWSEAAFAQESPIAKLATNNLVIVKPEYAAVVRAAYDPVMPVAADDPSHSLRLSARAKKLWDDLDEAEV